MHDDNQVDAYHDEMDATGTKPGIWRRWIVNPIRIQLVQGISPERLGWTVGAGVTLGIFPIFGTRAWLCLLAGWLFRLNQPVLHIFKSLSYPLHLLLLLPFVQMGQWLFGYEPLEVSVNLFEDSFDHGFWSFLQEFGWILLRAAAAWLLIAPVLLVAIRFVATPLLLRMKARKRAEVV